MSRRAALLVAALASCGAALAGAGGAHGQAPQATGGTAPAYPGNTIQIAHDGPILAAAPTTVKLSGHAAWNRPTDDASAEYTLALYVQDAAIDAQCSPTYGGQLQKSINLPGLNATVGISGWAVDQDLRVVAEPPSLTVDWAGDATPFAVRAGVRRVLLCAYQRYVIDDVAWYQLPVDVRQPSCRPAGSSVRRGAKLRLACDVSGPAELRFTRAGAGTRTLTAQLSTADGRGSVATGTLRPGRYRVSVTSNDVPLGSFRVRVRAR